MNAVGRNTVLPSRYRRLGERRDDARSMGVADPVLVARERPASVVVRLRLGHDVLGVRACLGLGECVRGERITAREDRQVALFLLLGAEEHDGLGAESAVHGHEHAERGVEAREFAEDV